MKLRHVLAPVDFSDLSAGALRYASLVARAAGAGLTVAYANSFTAPPYFTESQIEELNRQFRESVREAERALLDFTNRALQGAVPALTDVRVVEAQPVDGIRRVAAETGAELIVLGTHGRSGVSRFMLGSVAERVLRESAVPVLTVREPDKGAHPPERILCPVNDTPAARAALRYASSLALLFRSELTALHVSEHHRPLDAAALCSGLPAEERALCGLKELTRHGDPATEIIALARESACDLLVVGAQHRRFFDSTVLGSTTARVVRHAPCPVLTVISTPAGD